VSRLRPTVSPSPRATAEQAEQLAAGLGSRVCIDVLIPRTQTAAKMRLLSRKERFEAYAEAREAMTAAGFPVDGTAYTSLGADEQWQYELGVRILAQAIRDPRDPDRSLAPVDEWREECDDDQINALFEQYKDHQERVDPFASEHLSDAEQASLEAAAKKKDIDLLMSFGSRKLALFLLTTADPPASSPPPK
jgi:hypothetical protein